MVTHCIIMSSSYSNGTRIANDYCIDKNSDVPSTKKILYDRIHTIMERCGRDVSISTHYIPTDSTSWESVYKKDPFFKNVELIPTIEEFISIINKDRKLEGIDVAKYILSRIECTHLKIEKLVYLCYADYLCKTHKKLFEDVIYAFKYGPVIDSVYQRYKKYGYLPIAEEKKDIDSQDIFEMPSRSRILFAESGSEKCYSIDNTIEKYGNLSAGDLVDITHTKGSPWMLSYSGEEYVTITDKIILEHHKEEELK